jgi:hypothetical protein
MACSLADLKKKKEMKQNTTLRQAITSDSLRIRKIGTSSNEQNGSHAGPSTAKAAKRTGMAKYIALLRKFTI